MKKFNLLFVTMPTYAADMMRKSFGDNTYWPRNGMMGYWLDRGEVYGNLFIAYHVVVAILGLVILILLVVFLWKKIEMMEVEKKRK